MEMVKILVAVILLVPAGCLWWVIMRAVHALGTLWYEKADWYKKSE